MKQVKVAAAVILNEQQHIFLAKRPQGVHQGGKWELPGGKLEQDESALQALKRELFEELGIEVNDAESFLQISHQYPDKSVILNVFIVSDYSGRPWGKEGQLTMWANSDEIQQLDFPAANAEIVEQILVWLSENKKQ